MLTLSTEETLNFKSSTSRLLLITNKLHDSPAGGRELLNKLNHDVLKDLFGDRFFLFELTSRALKGISPALRAFKGHIDGLDKSTISSVIQIIQSEKVDKVFVDGSNLGEIVKEIKITLPQVDVITFFHNVESRFFWGSVKQQKSLRAMAILMANYFAERKSVAYSDKIICLSQRDSSLLQRVYGRSATHLSPMALQDKMPADFDKQGNSQPEKFVLFVGGIFYANRTGISWFVENVAPSIHIRTCIVGRGFEELRQELGRDRKVEVVGAVEHLGDWYRDAQFVIAPIFDGSGMKTKVAEALMYGKKIVGTPEAFSGYENIIEKAGWICETAEEFILAIKNAQDQTKLSFDPALRALYEELYSYKAARIRLKVILSN
jgi:glycosyltransferase involved in cell wall biosynthesis